MDRQNVGSLDSWPLDTQDAPAAVAASGVMFWLQAIRFIPKALPTARL